MLTPNYLIKSVFDINEKFLEDNKIKGIIFDIDNTLVGFTVAEPTDEICDFISALQSKGYKISIASNNNRQRVKKFCERLDVEYIHRACKPLPFALLKLAGKMGLRCREIMLVGDQVYTDALGANILGMTSVMVDIIDTKETFTFKLKRALEKPVINAKRRKDAKKNG